MNRNVANAERSVPVRPLDSVGPASDQIGPKQVKAGLRSGGVSLIEATKDAALRYYGSVKETAFALGQVDPSLMMREFDAGKFQRLDEHADVEAKAFIAIALADVFGPVHTPQARVRQQIRNARRALDEIEQGMEYLAS